MEIKTGVDIVEIEEFVRNYEKGGEGFVAKCFHADEIGSGKMEHLAGVFAAKEAVVKAFSLGAGSWLDIRIVKSEDGNPGVEISGYNKRVVSSDLSISHTKGSAVAQFVALIE